MAEGEGFEPQQEDESGSGWQDDLVNAAYSDDADGDDGDVRAQLDAANQRARNAELNSLVQSHPELAEPETARALMSAAAGIAQQYGLSTEAAGQPAFLALVADTFDFAGDEQQARDPEDIVGILDEAAEGGRRVLPFP
jgi:hypothetical protein